MEYNTSDINGIGVIVLAFHPRNSDIDNVGSM